MVLVELVVCPTRSGRQRVDEMMQNLANSVRNSQLQVEAVTHYHQVLHCTSSCLISSF